MAGENAAVAVNRDRYVEAERGNAAGDLLDLLLPMNAGISARDESPRIPEIPSASIVAVSERGVHRTPDASTGLGSLRTTASGRRRKSTDANERTVQARCLRPKVFLGESLPLSQQLFDSRYVVSEEKIRLVEAHKWTGRILICFCMASTSIERWQEFTSLSKQVRQTVRLREAAVHTMSIRSVIPVGFSPK